MYMCQITGMFSKPGEKLNKIVVSTREKTYYRWVRDEDTNKWVEIECGRGFETVKEINASEKGRELWETWSLEEREMFLQEI